MSKQVNRKPFLTEKERAAIKKKIVRFCHGTYRSAKEIAEGIGLPLNTVRAHYIYYMAEKGERYDQKVCK